MNPIVSIVMSIVGGMVENAVKNPKISAITPENAGAIQKGLVDSVLSSPELINAISAEWPIQSRIVWGAGAMVLVGAGGILANVMTADFNPGDYLTPAMTLVGGAYVLRARLANGLKPLFSKWFGPK